VDGIEALDPEHQCAEYWAGKAQREAAAAGLPAPERGAPRAPRPAGARGAGGPARGKRRRRAARRHTTHCSGAVLVSSRARSAIMMLRSQCPSMNPG